MLRNVPQLKLGLWWKYILLQVERWATGCDECLQCCEGTKRLWWVLRAVLGFTSFNQGASIELLGDSNLPLRAGKSKWQVTFGFTSRERIRRLRSLLISIATTYRVSSIEFQSPHISLAWVPFFTYRLDRVHTISSRALSPSQSLSSSI